MNDYQAFVFLHCLTPVHHGAGQGLGSLDRPLLRERTTNYPIIQADTLKGAFKAQTSGPAWEKAEVDLIFGRGETTGNQGALIFKEASLLALPVRSLAGTFAWVTSRLILARWRRWLDLFSLRSTPLTRALEAALEATSKLDDHETCALGGEKDGISDVAIRLPREGPYCLEGLVLEPWKDNQARSNWGSFVKELAEILFKDAFWSSFFRQRFLVVPSNAFDHLVQSATEVRANIRIGELGVTEEGSLRYTEFLPAETLLLSVAVLDRYLLPDGEVDSLWQKCTELLARPVQLGADESKGKGLVRPTLWPRPSEKADG